MNLKDEEKIVEMTSPNFGNGVGGETIREWLNNIILHDSKGLAYFKQMLNGSLKSYKNGDGNIIRASGNNANGEIYFVYENEDWYFGGIKDDGRSNNAP